MRRKVAADLGTNNTVIWSNGSIVTNEPTIVALANDGSDRIIAVGKEALEMLGKTPETITSVSPIVGGVVADFLVAKALLKIQLGRLGKSFEFFRPDVMMVVPSGSTAVERKACLEVALEAGAAHAYVVDASLAAAIGAGVAVSSAAGNVVLHVGAAVTEAAVISLGGVIAYESKRIGGNTINQNIKDYLKEKHGLVIGELTSEEIKKHLATAIPEGAIKEMEVSGRDLAFGMPKNIKVDSKEIHTAIESTLNSISAVLELALEKTPPELSSDVIDKGVVLTGGASRLNKFDKFITIKTGVPAVLAEDPELCAVRGAAVVLENLDLWKRSIATK